MDTAKLGDKTSTPNTTARLFQKQKFVISCEIHKKNKNQQEELAPVKCMTGVSKCMDIGPIKNVIKTVCEVLGIRRK